MGTPFACTAGLTRAKLPAPGSFTVRCDCAGCGQNYAVKGSSGTSFTLLSVQAPEPPLPSTFADRNIRPTSDVMQAEIHNLESNDHVDWNDFVRYQSPDSYDDYGWFHVTIGASGVTGGNDFQVCVATPRAVGRIKRDGFVPGIVVDQFDAATVEKAIRDRVDSVYGHSWEQLVDQLRKFMHWEYDGMAGS